MAEDLMSTGCQSLQADHAEIKQLPGGNPQTAQHPDNNLQCLLAQQVAQAVALPMCTQHGALY